MDMHMLRTWKIGRGTNQVYGKRDKNIFHSWKTTILVDIQFAVICYGKTAALFMYSRHKVMYYTLYPDKNGEQVFENIFFFFGVELYVYITKPLKNLPNL